MCLVAIVIAAIKLYMIVFSCLLSLAIQESEVIVQQVLDELGISLDHELSEITPGLEKPHIQQHGQAQVLAHSLPLSHTHTHTYSLSLFLTHTPSPSLIHTTIFSHIHTLSLIHSHGSFSLSLIHTSHGPLSLLQKKAVASSGGPAGSDTDDLQARLDQLRRGDDD